MNYYMTFNENGIFERGGCGENENCFKNINNRKVYEITKEQYENISFFKLVDGEIVSNQEKLNAKRKKEIFSRLSEIDLTSIRSLRAFKLEKASSDDIEKIEAYETEAEALREELGTL